MLYVRHEDRLCRAVRGPMDDREGQSALQEVPVKALQRREAALGARYEGNSAVATLIALAAAEQQRSD